MKPPFWRLFVVLSSLLGMMVTLRAETWPSLDKFVEKSLLVVKARQVGRFTEKDGANMTFEVMETWKGHFDPRDFSRTSPEGYINAYRGQHGVDVNAGQEIVFVFMRKDDRGKWQPHSTAFPVQGGLIIYASTAWGNNSRSMSFEEYKKGRPFSPWEMSVDQFKQLFAQPR